MKLKRLFLGSFLFVFLVLQLLSASVLIAPAKASALDVPSNQVTVTARFTSAARIVLTTTYNGQTAEIIYRDNDPLDTTLNYEPQDPHQCPSGDLNLNEPQNWDTSGETRDTPKLFSLLSEGGSSVKGRVDVDVLSSANGACANIGSGGSNIEVTITDAPKAFSYMAYKDYHTIARVFRDSDWTFVRDANDPTVFYRNGEGAGTECRDFVKVTSDGQRVRTYAIDVGSPRKDSNGNEIAGPDMPDGCNYDTSDDRLYDIGGSFNSESWNINRSKFATGLSPLAGTQFIENVDPNNPPPAATVDGESNEDNSCESKSGAMGWILCPVVNLLDGGMNWVDSQVSSLLAVDNNKFNDSGLEQSWKITRNLAYLILVPVVLVMVIGTALGFEFVSAYTVKRALPRLIVATIFIALSWTIVTFLVGFSNNIGAGVQGIMETPFRARFGASCQDNLNLACFFDVEPGFEDGILHGILFLPEAAATIVGLIIFLILFGATILTSVVIGFLVLLLRQMFILALMVLAPLAILAWIFPGNDKLWKSWWSLFSKLLIMYPLIMGLISTGRIFAAILKEADNNGGTGLDGGILNPVMRLAAYMLPYALIPLTFKFAGGTFAMVAGFADDKSKGLFDRQRAKRAERWGNFKSTGELPGFKGSNVAARGMQRIGRGVGAGAKGRYGFGERGRQRMGGMMQVAGDQALKEDAQLQKTLVAQDDTAAVLGLSGGTAAGARQSAAQLREHWYQQALAGGASEADARAKADSRHDRALASAQALGITRANATAAMGVMAQNKSRSIGNGRHDLIRDGVNRLAAGNTQLAQDLAYNYEYNSRQAGRIDLGGDWTSDTVRGYEAQAAEARAGGDEAAAQGYEKLARRATLMDGVKRTGTTDLVRGHSATTKQAAETIRADFASGDVERMLEAGSLLAELQGNLTYATGENRDVISGLMDTVGVDASGTRGSIDSQIVAKINATRPAGTRELTLEEFSNMTRSFSSNRPGNPNDPNNPQT